MLSINVPAQSLQASQRKPQAVSASTSQVFITVVPPAGGAMYNGPFTLGSAACPGGAGLYTCYGVYAPAASAAPGLYDRFIVDLYTSGGAILTTNHYNTGDGFQYIYTGSMYNTVSVHQQPVVAKIWYEAPSQCVPSNGSPVSVHVDFYDAANAAVSGTLANPVSVSIAGAGQFAYSGGSTTTTAVVGTGGSQSLQLLNAAPGSANVSFAGGNGLAVTGPQYPALYNVQAGFGTADGTSAVQLTGLSSAGAQLPPCGSVPIAGAVNYIAQGGSQKLFVTDSTHAAVVAIDLNANAASSIYPTSRWRTTPYALGAGGISSLAVTSSGSASYVFVGDSSSGALYAQYFDTSWHPLWGQFVGSSTSLSLSKNASGTYDVWVAGGSNQVSVIRLGAAWTPTGLASYPLPAGGGASAVAVAVDPSGSTTAGVVRGLYGGVDSFFFFDTTNPSVFGVYPDAASASPSFGPGSIGINGTSVVVATSNGLLNANLGAYWNGMAPSFSTVVPGAFQAVDVSGGGVALGSSPAGSYFSFYGTPYPVNLPAGSIAVTGGGFNASKPLSVNRRTH